MYPKNIRETVESLLFANQETIPHSAKSTEVFGCAAEEDVRTIREDTLHSLGLAEHTGETLLLLLPAKADDQ